MNSLDVNLVSIYGFVIVISLSVQEVSRLRLAVAPSPASAPWRRGALGFGHAAETIPGGLRPAAPRGRQTDSSLYITFLYMYIYIIFLFLHMCNTYIKYVISMSSCISIQCLSHRLASSCCGLAL